MDGKIASIDRLSDLAQQWFLAEPLLFAVWTTHRIVEQPNIATIRVGRGRIEVNADFIRSLDKPTLREVMKFEAVRIVLKHPYERKKQNSELSYEASNLAIQECMQTSLPIPTAKQRFGSNEHDQKHFEFYYHLLNAERAQSDDQGGGTEEYGEPEDGSCDSDDDDDDEADESGEDEAGECEGDSDCDGNVPGDSNSDGNGQQKALDRSKRESKLEDTGSFGSASGDGDQGNATEPSPPKARPNSDLPSYCEHELVGTENASKWSEDEFFTQKINDVITEIEASQTWGTVPGSTQEMILATLIPKLDYRKVLKAFRANVLSSNRRLTRMKPSRRYDFDYMGSRRDFCTQLLFAVDVSGSVGSADVQSAFSIVNRLFKYGIESIDVLWFDSEIRNEEPITLKKASREFAVDGRGGTNFQPLMDYLDEHRQYDGLIVFTDGIAPVPTRPIRNRRTRVVWLFNHEESWRAGHQGLVDAGMLTAFVLADA